MSIRTTLLSLAVGIAVSGSLFAQNNECFGAIPLLLGTNGPFTNAGSTTSAPAWPCGSGANDVWFSFVAASSGSVTVDTCGASIDTVLQVFQGGQCATLTSLGCNDDSCGTGSSLTVPVLGGSHYRVRVAGYGGVTGSFPVRLQGPVVGSTHATNTTRGIGCNRNPASFYEYFMPGTCDLSFSSLSMFPSGGSYFVTHSNPTFLAPSASAIVLPLLDDSLIDVPLSTPMPHPGGTTSTLTVSSNGFVAVPSSPPPSSMVGPTGLLNATGTGWYIVDDFDPTILFGGRVKFEQVGTKACVTWDGVWAFGGTAASARTFQFQFDTSNGNVHFVFQNVNTNNWLLVGYSPGGPSYDNGSMDISAQGSFNLPAVDGLPLTVTPATRPVIGTGWSLNVTNYPANSTLGVDILGFTDPGLNDLTSIGMPTCGLRASLDVLSPWAPSGTTHNFTIGIPPVTSVLGLHLYTTSAVFAPGVNAFGAISANGVDGLIGDF
jgi:hypothetical protein